jgi:Helix-turn-helix domain
MLATRSAGQLESRIDWWRRVIARQRAAQVTLAQFCREMGITPRKFYYWKKRVRNTSPAATGERSGLRQSPPPAPAPGQAAGFVPVSIKSDGAAASLEIELANGCAIRLKGLIDPDLLRAAITSAGELDRRGRGGC